MRVNHRGEAEGKGAEPGPWWTECGQAGGTKVSAPQTELYLLTHCPWNFSFLFHAAQL